MIDEAVGDQYLPVAEEALDHFPVKAVRVEAVAVSENVTFRVVGSRGQDYCLRLHRPGYNSLPELESERLWSGALADSGLNVQGALAARDGNHFVLLDVPGTVERRFAGMTYWLPGVLMSDHLEAGATALERRRLFHEIGRLAAKIHNQSAGWREPGGFRRPSLDVEGLLGERPRWGRFWDHGALTSDEKALLSTTRTRLRAALEQYAAASGSFGLIHADLHPDNIVLAADKLGLIDFDDCAYGWHMYDLASALIEHWGASDFDVLQQAILSGYRQERPLSTIDESMLPEFLLIRGMALIGWFHQRPEHSVSEFFLQVKNRVIAVSAKQMQSAQAKSQAV